MAEYNRRLKEYNDKTSERAQQIERATAEPFPAEAFNRLIDQVNKFFIEGL